jgi:hypothetical protein
MTVGMGTLLVTVGAILAFALPATSPSWLNLRVAGVILILALPGAPLRSRTVPFAAEAGRCRQCAVWT